MSIPTAWKDIIPSEIPDYPLENSTPKRELIFKAFELVDPKDVKVVIIGQDPYQNKGLATGVAFSVPDGTKIPPSLKNIFNNLVHFGHLKEYPKSGNIEHWSKAGILLINASLTTELGTSNEHVKYWKVYTDEIIKNLINAYPSIRFLLFGQFAINKCPWNVEKICCSHPSPFSYQKKSGGFPSFEETDVFKGIDFSLKIDNSKEE